MPYATEKSAFWAGTRDAAPFVLVAGPLALLFGVLATEAGLNLLEVMSFSVIVIAGAAQFTALQLMQDNAPTLVVIASALAVNLRMAMYSAALTPFLGRAPLWKRACVAYLLVDQSYALSHGKYEEKPLMPLNQRLGYYFGSCFPVIITWFGATYAGAALGSAIPPDLPLDFALPIAFLAMVAPMLRTLAHLGAAVTSMLLSLVFAGVPYSLGLLLAAMAGMIVGAAIEKRMEGAA